MKKLLTILLSVFMMFSSCLMISAEESELAISATQNDNGDLVINIQGTDAESFIKEVTNADSYKYISLKIGNYFGILRGNSVKASDGFVTISKEDLNKGGFISGNYTMRCISTSGRIYESSVSLTLDNTVTATQLETLKFNDVIKTPIVGDTISGNDADVNIVDVNGKQVARVSYRWTKKDTRCSSSNDDGSCETYSDYYVSSNEHEFKEGETYYYTVQYCYTEPLNGNIATVLNSDSYQFENVGGRASKAVSGMPECGLETEGVQYFVAAFTPTKVVAKIGNTGYASLQEAINEASDGSTIDIQDDLTVDTLTVTGDKTLTLNTNGKTITQNYSKYANYGDYKRLFDISGKAKLTITGNGTFVGPNDESGATHHDYSLIKVSDKDTKLTIVNGKFTVGGSGSDGMYGIYSLNGATVILGDEETKTGPTINSFRSPIGQNNTKSPSNITIYGGNYTSRIKPTGLKGDAYWECSVIYAPATGSMNIYGGTFTGYYGISSPYKTVTQNINIYGGTFNTTNISLFVDTKEGAAGQGESRKISISGGIFSSDVSAYLADGYDIAKVGDKYAVAKKNEKLPEVKVDENTATIAEKVTKETLKDTNVKVIDNEGKQIQDIDSKHIVLESTNKDESYISENKATIKEELIKEVAKESKKVETNNVGLIPLDVTLKVVTKDNTGAVTKTETVSEISKSITVTIYLDNETLDKLSGSNKVIKVVRIHDNETKVLDATLVNNTLSFETDRFSTYVIAYSSFVSTNNTSNTSSKTYSAKDKNQDGIITCDEEMNSANWVWSTSKGACVYKVSNTSAR